jgi:hypothetical protein
MKNRVELLGYYGDDLIHACSAWTSTSRELTAEKLERIPKLLTMLAKELGDKLAKSFTNELEQQ